MGYTKQNFIDGQTLTAAKLNHMEAGIAAAWDMAGSGTGGGAVTGIPGAAGDGETDDTEALTAALSQSNCVVDGGNKKYKYFETDPPRAQPEIMAHPADVGDGSDQ